jgi:hypothetical protein
MVDRGALRPNRDRMLPLSRQIGTPFATRYREILLADLRLSSIPPVDLVAAVIRVTSEAEVVAGVEVGVTTVETEVEIAISISGIDETPPIEMTVAASVSARIGAIETETAFEAVDPLLVHVRRLGEIFEIRGTRAMALSA